VIKKRKKEEEKREKGILLKVSIKVVVTKFIAN
jgi:hypothetical protein